MRQRLAIDMAQRLGRLNPCSIESIADQTRTVKPGERSTACMSCKPPRARATQGTQPRLNALPARCPGHAIAVTAGFSWHSAPAPRCPRCAWGHPGHRMCACRRTTAPCSRRRTWGCLAGCRRSPRHSPRLGPRRRPRNSCIPPRFGNLRCSHLPKRCFRRRTILPSRG